MSASPRPVSFPEAFRFWLKLGFISFGGPTGQIAIMHEELVERRRWVSHDQFLHALQFCMVLPGPEAQQLATYLGWLMHGVPGGLIAGGLFLRAQLRMERTMAYENVVEVEGLNSALAQREPLSDDQVTLRRLTGHQ